MSSATEQLASFLSNVTYDDLSPKLIQHAKASILNALGCALGGASASPAIKARKAVLPLTSAQTSTIIGRPERTDVQTAALVNGIALTNADYDDTHLKTVIHPSGAVLCAILAWGEQHQLPGKDILLAFIVGVEAQLRVGNCISPGSFGAAAAVAKLLNLSSEQFAFALGHAASLAGGTRAANGTDTKTLHMGRGAQNGILAALLAQQEFNTGQRPVEYWGNLVSTTVTTNSMTDDLGGTWELLENTFKPYPCGIVIHPLVDGCLAARTKGVKYQEVTSIQVSVNPQCMRLCFVQHPKTALEAIFSLYHGCAVALIYGQAGPKQFSDAVCNEDIVASVRAKIDVTTDKSLRDDEALLNFILKDGTFADEHIEHAKGSLETPLTKEELEAKFLDQSEAPIGKEQCEKVMSLCWTLEGITDISQLLQLCRPETK